MPIFIDFNQIVISSIIVASTQQKVEPDSGFIRHIVFNTIRSINMKFKNEYGPEVVICCDARNYWRKEFYPFYKANRKKTRDKSQFDWVKIFEMLNQVKAELCEFSQYKVLEVDGAEADDIIAVLTKEVVQSSILVAPKILIVSSDKDFLQLQVYHGVNQYSPRDSKFLHADQPLVTLKEHIIRGDVGDGIPNILSDSDTFVNPNKRQKVLKEAKVQELLADPKPLDRNDISPSCWMRNTCLIDFDKIPVEIKEKIITEYVNLVPKGSKSILLKYFYANRMRAMVDRIQDF